MAEIGQISGQGSAWSPQGVPKGRSLAQIEPVDETAQRPVFMLN